MKSSQPDSLRKAHIDLESYIAELTQELEQAQRTRDELEKLLSSVNNVNRHPMAKTVAPILRYGGDDSVPSQDDVSTTNGVSPREISRRQAIRQIIPEFKGQMFTPRELRERYVERYPQEDTKSLPPTISSLLRDMAEKGELARVERGEKTTDPWHYRKTQDNGDTLLGP